MENKKVDDFKLVEFGADEGKEVMSSIEAILVKFNGTIVAIPLIQPNGTIAASAQLFKKVKIEPVAQNGILSPKEYQNGGESNTTETAKKPD